MRLRALRLLAVLLSTALVAVGCGEDAAAPGGQNLTPIRVAVFPAGATLPVHAALTEGIFERHGLRIELTEGQDLPVFMAALAKGQYDIAETLAQGIVDELCAVRLLRKSETGKR